MRVGQESSRMTLRKLFSYLTVCLATFGLLLAVPGCPKSEPESKPAAKTPPKPKPEKPKAATRAAKAKPSKRVISEE